MKKLILALCIGSFSHYASASLLVQQYTGFQSNNVQALKNYADTHSANTSTYWDIIDFTDDPNGFVGLIPGSNPWPSANAIGATGTGGINNNFFAKITGSFYTPTTDNYTFRTFNDDGVFLYIDNILTISDTGYHPEAQFLGTRYLPTGVHTVELYFFENGGEASLEFSLANSSGVFTHPNQVHTVPESELPLLIGFSFIGLWLARKLGHVAIHPNEKKPIAA